MISTDFAPNEQWDDALIAFKTLVTPWRWKRRENIQKAKKEIISTIFCNAKNLSVHFFLAGRSALFFLLQSLHLPKKSQVLVQGFTCEAVVLPIIAQKIKPVYVDIEKQTLSMDFDDLKKKITPNTKVLILQHTFGVTPVNREKILALAKENNLFVIEDCAHGFDPHIISSNNMSKTTNAFLLSFGRTKSLSSVFGSAIVTSKPFIGKKLQDISEQLPQPSFIFIFRSLLFKPLALCIKSTYDIGIGKLLHFITNKLHVLIPEITEKERRGEYNPLFNLAYPNALSTLLLHQLKKYSRTQHQRKTISQYYFKNLSNVTRYTLHVSRFSLLRFPLLVNDRNRLLERFRSKNMFISSWYDQVVAPKSLDLAKVFYKPGTCPEAEKVCKNIINLPTNIEQSEAKKIIDIMLTMEE